MKIIRTVFLLLSIIALPFIGTLSAQDSQISMDTDGRIQYVTSELEKTLRLFPEYPGFMEARLYMISENEYTLDILYKDAGNIQRKRVSLDNASLFEFRQKVSAKLTESGLVTGLDQEGRYLFVAGTTIYSLVLYSPAASVILDIERNYLTFHSVIGATGFFLPYFLTYDRQVTDASAYSYIYGSYLGIIHGLFAGMIFFGEDWDSPKAIASLLLVSSLAEGIGGFFAAEEMKLTAAQVDLTANMSVWGTLWTGELMVIIFNDMNIRAAGALLLAGSFSGGYLGYHLSTIEDYSRGDVIVQNVASMLGAYVPFAVTETSGIKNIDIIIASTLAGSVFGTAAGYHLIKDKNFSIGQGGLISLGTVAGGLLGQGIAHFTSPGNGAMYLSLSSLGALAGFSALYSMIHDNVIVPDTDHAFNIHIMPMGLSSFFTETEKKVQRPDQEYVSDSVPIIVLEYRF